MLAGRVPVLRHHPGDIAVLVDDVDQADLAQRRQREAARRSSVSRRSSASARTFAARARNELISASCTCWASSRARSTASAAWPVTAVRNRVAGPNGWAFPKPTAATPAPAPATTIGRRAMSDRPGGFGRASIVDRAGLVGRAGDDRDGVAEGLDRGQVDGHSIPADRRRQRERVVDRDRAEGRWRPAVGQGPR